MVVALVTLGVVLATNASAAPTTTSTSTSTTSTTSTASSTSTTAAAGAASLVCAQRAVANWPLSQLANETIVVPVNAANVGAMVPTAQSGYAGFLLFGAQAPVTLAATIARVQARSLHGWPLLVMTDEEGGGVQRLTNVIGSIPWAQTMGKNLSPSQIEGIGRRIGSVMLNAGVNVDLAPVLDVDGRAVEPGATDPDGLRSFSGTASVAASAGTAFMTGLQAAGVVSVVKHFPGLGGSSGNTDNGPASTLAWSVLRRSGLIAFEAAIAHGATAVMLSNARVPGLTSVPASISPVVVNELRTALGFRGLIMTDSLSAVALSASGLSVPQASVRALEAGANVVLYGSSGAPAVALSTAQQISAAIVAAVDAGALSRTTLLDDAARVLATRNVIACSP